MRVNIELKLDSILDFSSPDDLILFYFSGHGVSDPEGKGYLLPVDTAMDKAFYTSVKVEDIIKRMQDKGIKKSLLILDACRDVLTSSKSSNKQGLQADKYENAEVAATFFSTKAGYYSFEDPKSDFGVFTKALAYGLEGKADMDNDGVISFSELEAYVQNNVSEWSQVNNKKQIPYVKYHREKFGDLPITVRGKREKSLVEENDYGKGDSKLPALWRSALLPGWGQWYDGGKEKAVSFFAIWGILGTYTFQKYNQYQVSEKDYTASSGVPAFAGQGDMLAINYFLIHPKRDEALQKSQNFQLALTGMGLFYVLNLVDISFYKKNEYFWTFHIQVTPDYSNFLNPQRTASFPQHANIFFEYKF